MRERNKDVYTEEKTMKISGSGTISSSIYNEEIRVSGSARIEGDVSCTEFHVSGAVYAGGSVKCSGAARISGSGDVAAELSCLELESSGSITAESIDVIENLKISGTGRAKKSVRAKQIKVSGKLCAGTVKGETVAISGSLECGDVDAESFSCSGPVRISGLLNAGSTDMRLTHGSYTSTVNSVGGTNICAKLEEDGAVNIFSIFNRRKYGKLIVSECIEGDEIYLENTECPLVVGKNVIIGEGCKIGKVQYYGTCEVKDGAKVEETEKI